MSKFKTNESVVIKATGQTGVIKSREIITDGPNHVKVEYIVKTGDGFENWGSYTKKELEKVHYQPTPKPNLSIVLDAKDGYKVTLVAIVDTTYGPYEMYRYKTLNIGYSIYNPNDEYNEEMGKRIATHRAKNRPFCYLFTYFGGEFNNETVMALLNVKGEYIVNNIDNFLPENK